MLNGRQFTTSRNRQKKVESELLLYAKILTLILRRILNVEKGREWVVT